MISSPNIASNYSEAGVRKASLSALNLLLLGFFAGMFIALAGAASSIGSAMFENLSAAKLVSSIIFPAGLAMVVLTGSELFTGNSLMIISLLDKKIGLPGLLKNFILVYLGNFLGSLLVSSIFVYSHTTDMFNAGLAQNLLSTAAAKTSLTFSDAFLRAILCNVLVCIAVWMTMSAERVSGKIAALYPPIMVFCTLRVRTLRCQHVLYPDRSFHSGGIRSCRRRAYMDKLRFQKPRSRHPRKPRGRHGYRRRRLLVPLPES